MKHVVKWILKIIGWIFILASLNGLFRYDNVFNQNTSPNHIINIIVIIIFLVIGLTLISKTSKK
mgnify:CR=1 FL=1